MQGAIIFITSSSATLPTAVAAAFVASPKELCRVAAKADFSFKFTDKTSCKYIYRRKIEQLEQGENKE